MGILITKHFSIVILIMCVVFLRLQPNWISAQPQFTQVKESQRPRWTWAKTPHVHFRMTNKFFHMSCGCSQVRFWNDQRFGGQRDKLERERNFCTELSRFFSNLWFKHSLCQSLCLLCDCPLLARCGITYSVIKLLHLSWKVPVLPVPSNFCNVLHCVVLLVVFDLFSGYLRLIQ